MKKPERKSRISNKRFSYIVAWGCMLIACILLLPLILQSEGVSVASKVITTIVSVIIFLLGCCSVIAEVIDIVQNTKEHSDGDKEE